jgi:hypothetical protein
MKRLREIVEASNPLSFQKIAKKMRNKAFSAALKKAPENAATLKVKAMNKVFPGKLK